MGLTRQQRLLRQITREQTKLDVLTGELARAFQDEIYKPKRRTYNKRISEGQQFLNTFGDLIEKESLEEENTRFYVPPQPETKREKEFQNLAEVKSFFDMPLDERRRKGKKIFGSGDEIL